MTLRQAVIALLSPATFPLIVPLWLAELRFKPRLGRVIPERIGHLCLNTDLLLRRRHLGQVPKDATVILFASGPVSNATMMGLYRRQVPIFVNNLASKLFTLCEPWLKLTRFHVALPVYSGRDDYELFDSAPALVSFTPEEEARGRRGLRRLGIGENDWFVCFFNRDSSYLERLAPRPGYYAYHDYRDTDIKNFVPAALWIAGLGGFAVRMGSSVRDPLPPAARHTRVIDYAGQARDEFMDVYLLAKCRFVLASDTGLAQVATVFATPVVNTNVPNLDWASFRKQDLFIQKKFADAKTGRILSWSEVLDRGLERQLDERVFSRLGIVRVENTPEEILEAAREMNERLAGRWAPQPDDERLQRAYRSLFTPSHYCFRFAARVGADFLRRNKDDLLPERNEVKVR